jgi:hypothetical protein
MVLSAGAALGLLAAIPQTAQAAALLIDGNVTERPFTFHWMVDTNDNERIRGSRTDWAAMFDFGALPVQRNAICLYEHWFSLDVRTTGMSLTQSPNFAARYDATIARMLGERVPVGFAGMICIDIEFLPKNWGNRTGGPGIYPTQSYATYLYDDWYRYVSQSRPELIRGKSVADAERALSDSYEQVVRDFFTMTVDRMRAHRPDAKFGFYGVPNGSRHGQYARPAPNPWRDTNDRYQWSIDIADVVFVPLYQNRFTIPDGAPQAHWWWQMTIAQSKAWINENIAEARRLAPQKPVYALAMCRYPETNEMYANQWLDDLALDSMFRQPKRAGADGIVIWDFISSQAEYNALRSYMTERVFPIIAETATRPPTPPAPPGPGGGEEPPSPPPEPPAPPQPPAPPEPPAPPQPPAPPEPPAPPQPPAPPEPPAPPHPPAPPEPPAPPQPPSPPEPPAPPQPPAPPAPPEPPAPPQPPALGGDGGGTPPTPPPAPGAGDGPAGGSGDGSGQNPPAPPVPNPFARGGGGTLGGGGGGGGGGMSPPTPPAPPSPPGGSGGQGGQGGTSGGASPGGTGGSDGGAGGQGFRPATPGTGGGQPTVGPVPDKGGTAAPAPARRIGITKGGRVIDLVPRTKVVTGATPLRRTVIEQVAPPQIRTRNLTPTPILAASAGQPRSTTSRQTATRTTVWWKRLAAADDSKD